MKKHSVTTNEKRTVSEFLFWPKTIDGETRWFTYEKWEEKYQPKPLGIRESLVSMVIPMGSSVANESKAMEWKAVKWL